MPLATFLGHLRPTLASVTTTLILLAAVPATAEQIRWRSGPLDTTLGSAAEVAQDIVNLRSRAPEARHIVVQFSEPVTAEQRAALAQAGLNLLNYVGDNAFFAAVADGAFDAAAIGNQRTLGLALPIDRDWKLHPSFVADIIHPWSIVEAGDKEAGADDPDPLVAGYVLFHPDIDLLTGGVPAVQAVGGRVRSHLFSVNGLVIELPASQIKPLADDDRVQYLEPPLPQMAELNDSNRVITQADIVQAAPYGLNGSGINVLVYDGGSVRASHVDFGGRATVRDTSGLSDHATHVSATIGGSGAASGGLRRGMAPAVTIQSYGFEQPGGLQQGFLYTDPGDIEADYSQAINVHGVDIANNSIGTNTAPNGFPCSWEGDYGVTSAVIDAIVRGDGSNPLFSSPFRVIWANGNERGSGACGTTYHTTAPPACAKNHITVGALNSNDDSVTSFTSWGPADDGRLKPDVSAPGCQSGSDGGVTSASSSSDSAYTVKCGTSMASPTMCGLAALLLQDYRAQFPGESDPRNSTLKVLFAHTAADLFNVGPDYQTGYGSVRVQEAIDLMRAENFLEDTVSQGDIFSATVVVAPGQTELKVTLAWDDVPAAPNANPVLVNDLDLHVYAPNGTRHFPWTLNPASPANPAVRTQEDHINNIEQVVVTSPAAGAWHIEVRGFSVPQGPQPFSLTGTPLLVNCTDAGTMDLDRAKYTCAAGMGLRVVDCDLNTNDFAVETVSVTVASSSEPGGETVLLTESAAETATFVGNIPLSTVDAAGVLLVAPGDTVTATYLDADDGAGGVDVIVTDVAVIDCVAPLISGVQATNIGPRNATINFNTSELATSTVHYGATCGALGNAVSSAVPNTGHALNISGLTDNTTYFYTVEATDEAGNQATDDGGGACYAFSTTDIPNFFTELFDSDNDLDNKLITFTPNATVDQYHGCIEDITSLPTNPVGGIELPFDDDAWSEITLTGGATVQLYGVTYNKVFPSSNGYIAFEFGDQDYSETLADHFAQARVAGLFDDLNVDAGGSISYRQLADRFVVTWLNVPQYNTGDQNTFQIELFFDGTIRIAYLSIGALDGIAGLSAGNGLDPDFFETDLSGLGACGPQPPVAGSTAVATPANVPLNIVLPGSDDGLPDPPAALATTITTLPAKATLFDPNGGAIVSVPHTLASGGNTVQYQPLTNLYGADSFNFKVNDSGVPPEGGDSNEAAVGITIVANAPVAQNMNLNVDIDTSSLLALDASDPDNDPLDMIITTLPEHAALFDPAGGEITSVPYTLLNNGAHVRYEPQPGYAGSDAFAFKAQDAIFESNAATVTLLVVAQPPQIISSVLPHGMVGATYGPVQLEKFGGQPNVSWSLITEIVYIEDDLGTSGFAEVGTAQGWHGDDMFWTLNLPFAFPFYGASYTEVRVWSNGMINFGAHNGSSHNNSEALLASNRRIAPLWDDLRTDQPGDDIFVDMSTSGEITIRWQAATYSALQPVSFSTTLHENGDIVFHYGPDNAAVTPTVGVSDGTGTDYTLSAYAGATSLQNANSVRLRVPISLPAGMSISPAGLVAGTPAESGVFEPVVRLDDSLGRSDLQALLLVVFADSGVSGDYDGDGDVDLADFSSFVECLFGPDTTPEPLSPATTQMCLHGFDLNQDGDVDLQDMAAMESLMTP